MFSNARLLVLFSTLLVTLPVHAVVIDDFSDGEVRLLGPSETVSQVALESSAERGASR